MSQAQRLASPLQRSRGGSASPPNPKSSPAAPLHLLEHRSPLSRPRPKVVLEPKIQLQATSRHLAAAQKKSQSSPRDLCRQRTEGSLGKTSSLRPNPNPLSRNPVVLNLRQLLTRRTCQGNVQRVQQGSQRRMCLSKTKSLLLCLIKKPLPYQKEPRLWCLPG